MQLLTLTKSLLVLTFFCQSSTASPAEDVAASAKKLAQTASFLPNTDGGEVRQNALAIILLSEYGRLLPANPSSFQWETLEKTFLAPKIEETICRQLADAMPSADIVSFDGKRLNGGGFSRIDHILGTNRCPIAFDRRLPTRYIPLNAGEENRLHEAAVAFTATPAAKNIRQRTDALYRVRLTNMVGDGLFYRPYGGRTDDLYYRLVQENPRPSTELNFYAIVESLPGRHFHPLSGIGAPAFVPSPWFSMSETLSGGGLLAVENFKNRHPRADVRNPFFGFAARVLPFLGQELENTKPGENFNVSKEIIRSAIQSSRRFTPEAVPAIFHDPSHFFSSLSSKFTLVARRLSHSRMAEEIKKIDFSTPLPDVPGGPVGNEVLANPPNLKQEEFLQELPALLDLDASSLAEKEPPTSRSPQGLPITSETTINTPLSASQTETSEKLAATIPMPIPADNPLVAALPITPLPGSSSKSEPHVADVFSGGETADLPPAAPLSPAIGHYLAIITPDIAASEKYLQAIALSDSFFSKNATTLQRVNCYLKWLNAALAPVEAYLQNTPGPATAQTTELRALTDAVQDQLATLLEQRIYLQKERSQLLSERGQLRTEIEGAPLQRSASQLDAILGRPTKVSGSATPGIIYL